MSGGLNSVIAQFACSISSLLRDYRTRTILYQGFGKLGRKETDMVLRDCGLDRVQFAKSLQNPLISEDLLSSAMALIGLDCAALGKRHPAWSNDMARVCMACPYRRRCRADVSARHVDALRTYCPNEPSFQELEAPEPGIGQLCGRQRAA